MLLKSYNSYKEWTKCSYSLKHDSVSVFPDLKCDFDALCLIFKFALLGKFLPHDRRDMMMLSFDRIASYFYAIHLLGPSILA